MAVSIVEPPLTEYAQRSPDGRLVNWLWGEIKDELISGELKPWLYTPYAVGEIGPELVGSLAYYTSTYNREVGLIQFVETAEEHRSKGIMSALMSALIEKFNAEGGLALMLCTGNPIAGSLYEKHGFWYTIGDGLRYLAPGAEDFEESFFAHNGAAQIREATWADLPYASALYNHPEPGWLVKDHLTKTFRDTRYESHFVKLLRRIEDERGGCLVLENPNKRVVGLAAFERMDTYQEQHVGTTELPGVPGILRAGAGAARRRGGPGCRDVGRRAAGVRGGARRRADGPAARGRVLGGSAVPRAAAGRRRDAGHAGVHEAGVGRRESRASQRRLLREQEPVDAGAHRRARPAGQLDVAAA